MSVRSNIEDSAIGIAKSHDHNEVLELHILRALLTKFGTDGAGVTNKDVDEKLSQVKSASSATIAISTDAYLRLKRQVRASQNRLQSLLKQVLRLCRRLWDNSIRSLA
jgi:hypothetical protein